MKRLIRRICVVLAAVCLLSVPVLAETEVQSRASYFFTTTCTYLYPTTGTNFEVWFDLVGTGTMEEIGVSEIKVQRSLDQTNWTTVKTYTPEYYPQLLAEDTVSHGACVTYIGTNWYYYRALVTFYAKDERGTGMVSRYTDTIFVTP